MEGWLLPRRIQRILRNPFLTGLLRGQGSKKWNLKLVTCHVPLRCKKVRNSITARIAAFSAGDPAKPPREQNRRLPPAARRSGPPSPIGGGLGTRKPGDGPGPLPRALLSTAGCGGYLVRPDSSEALSLVTLPLGPPGAPTPGLGLVLPADGGRGRARLGPGRGRWQEPDTPAPCVPRSGRAVR